MSHASGPCDFATVLSQQRFLRQQEQQVRAELLRLSRTRPAEEPRYRPLSPPPPQRPIERRVNHAEPYGFSTVKSRTDGPGVDRREDRDSGLRKRLHSPSLELRQQFGVVAAVTQRQTELQQQQRERLLNIQQQHPFLQLPAPYGGSAIARNISRPHKANPYIFDSGVVHDSFGRFSRPQRAGTSPLDARSGVRDRPGVQQRQGKRQSPRLSPRWLPAAGLPSGNRRVGEDGNATRQRRQVLPLDVEAVASVLPFGDQRQLLRDVRSTQRQWGLNAGASGHVGASVVSANGTVPSTTAPALHPDPAEVASLSQQQTNIDGNSKWMFSARPQVGGRTSGSWNNEQQPDGIREEQLLQGSERQGIRQSDRRKHFVSGEVAAGKPSARDAREAWDFRLSLRGESDRKTSASKPAAAGGASRATGGVSHNSSYASTRELLSDDEAALRGMGLRLSPRELLFFKKQPSLRRKQQRSNSRPARNSTAVRAAKGTGTEMPARSSTLAGHELEANLASSWPRSDGLRLTPLPDVWSLPAWMRAYGVSDSLARSHPPSGATTRFVSPMSAISFQPARSGSNDAAYATFSRVNGQTATVCGCRCCRLRAAGKKEPEDLSCCCCPCCSSWSNAPGVPHVADLSGDVGDNDVKANSASEKPSASGPIKSKCSRCGRWSEKPSSPGGVGQPPVESLNSRVLTLEEAASLCQACATYLECERERSAPGVTSPWRDGEVLGSTNGANKPTEFRLSAPRHRAAPPGSANFSSSKTSSPGVQALCSSLGSPVPVSAEGPKSVKKVIVTKKGPALPVNGPHRRSFVADGIGDDPPALKGTAHRRQSTVDGQQRLIRGAASGSARTAPSSEEPSSSVWESPRIAAKICLFLSLSKLLLVRRCNRTFLQAAQYRMRYILYKSLHLLLHQPADSPLEKPVVAEGHHCPISAEALINLLGLEPEEVDAVRAGSLPAAYAPEAATPRMENVAAALRREKRALTVAKKEEVPSRLTSGDEPKVLTKATFASARPVAATGEQPPSSEVPEQSDLETKQRLLLDAHMAARQASEEASLQSMLQADRQLEQPATFGYDEAAGPAAPYFRLLFPGQSEISVREPATFRRVRHSFLKLWNYDDETFRQAVVRATSNPYPPWLFDMSALLLRAAFQICCNSLSAPPLKDLVSLFAPRCRPGAGAEVPCRADSYLWAKMARISGYGMHLVSDSTWPPQRDPVVRLVAQPFINPEAFINGSGVDEATLQHAAANGGVVPLILRPAVMDSLELKMSKVHPEFIAEFLSYGKQQQQLHSVNHQLLLRGGMRHVKASQELVLLMDLYEWLASVLTHNQRSDAGMAMHKVPSTRIASAFSTPKDLRARTAIGAAGIQGVFRLLGEVPEIAHAASASRTPSSNVQTAKQIREPLRPPKGLQARHAPLGLSSERPRRFTPLGRRNTGTVCSADAKTLCALIEEQGAILREVCRLLRSMKSHGSRLAG